MDIEDKVNAIKSNILRNHVYMSENEVNRIVMDFVNEYPDIKISHDFDKSDTLPEIEQRMEEAKEQDIVDFENDLYKDIKKMRDFNKKIKSDYVPGERRGRNEDIWGFYNDNSMDYENTFKIHAQMLGLVEEQHIDKQGKNWEGLEINKMVDMQENSVLQFVSRIVTDQIEALKNQKNDIMKIEDFAQQGKDFWESYKEDQGINGQEIKNVGDFEDKRPEKDALILDFYDDARRVKALVHRLTERLNKGE